MARQKVFKYFDMNEFCKIAFIVVLLIHVDFVLPQSNENLLKNYSFEKIFFMQNHVFSDWQLPHNNYVTQSKDYVYEGRYSAKMCSQETGNTAAVSQLIEVIPNSKIRIRHHYYITQWKDKGARMYCYFREREAESSKLSNEYLNNFYDMKTLRIIRGGGYDLTYFPHTTNEWLVFDEVITIPPDAKYFAFEIHSFYGTTMYVDDCYVGYEEISSIGDITSEVTSLTYYSLNGQKLMVQPSKGAYLLVTTDSNGNKIIQKQVR